MSADVPAVGYGSRVSAETLGRSGYSTSGTPPNTSNPSFCYFSTSYVTSNLRVLCGMYAKGVIDRYIDVLHHSSHLG